VIESVILDIKDDKSSIASGAEAGAGAEAGIGTGVEVVNIGAGAETEKGGTTVVFGIFATVVSSATPSTEFSIFFRSVFLSSISITCCIKVSIFRVSGCENLIFDFSWTSSCITSGNPPKYTAHAVYWDIR
jgi:hypothetical protein